MGNQAESKLSRKIMEALRLEGVFCFKVHGSSYMMPGLPDIIACVDGYFLGLETKMPAERENVSSQQRRVHSMIAAAQGEVSVVCSVAEAIVIVRSIRAKKPESLGVSE